MDLFETSWKYLASAMMVDINDLSRFKRIEGSDSVYKITAGRKISLIISMASVIEGGVRAYLSLKVLTVKKDHRIISDLISNYREFEEKKELNFVAIEPIENYQRKIEELDKIIRRFSKKTQLSNIDNGEWGSLKKIFRLIHDYDISKSFNKVDNNLAKDLDYIFHFRNFLVHSNLIGLKKIGNNEIEYQGTANRLNEYITEKKLNEDSKEFENIFFIEELLPDKLIFHFKIVLTNFLKVVEFNQLPSMKNEIARIKLK